ncbi:hypothetical protein P8H27_18555 [Pseudomonas sp. sp1636]|uniref:hypothetical protein n=1 Tax=Pseudomonas sp. sp1636 TaxID=3036707 RepID=UPI0025A5A6B1|nr:hypothetical protein [Pseudomonas sp. sp1636]MDM8350880.1 hypothetical protein [Pseudomonas sp. sp1636]
MRRFKILSGQTLIGWSDLEAGDPPMGVAFGQFIPITSYDKIQASIIASNELDQYHLSLSAKTAENLNLEATGGIHITDLSTEFGGEAIEVSVLGIESSVYEKLFPEHVLAYKNQFS